MVFDMDPHENIISSTRLQLEDKIAAAVNELQTSTQVQVAQNQYLKYINKWAYEIKEMKYNQPNILKSVYFCKLLLQHLPFL